MDQNKYWKSGVGYGHSDRSNWDIKAFIREREESKMEIIKLLDSIYLKIKPDSSEVLFTSVLPNYLINQIKGSSLLDIQKNNDFYYVIFKILNKLTTLNIIPQEFINQVAVSLKGISEGILMLITNSNLSENSKENEFYIIVHCANDWFQSRKKLIEKVESDEIIKDQKSKYLEMVKKEQFKNCPLQKNHRFNKEKFLDGKLSTKALMRIASEISTFKTSLPIDWDTSILVRVPQDNINLITFVITGPKDTPYHNGIFEFHARFPSSYPNTVPQVLLDTTGNGSVRFNPNLYNCGKVCLSLLGTWSGQGGEQWHPETSTFLQILVSIQSLILVEQPYFNEPGWERQMHTTNGKMKSFNYNDKLRLETIRWCINDKIKHPPFGYENFVKEHFQLKKEELISVTEKWVSESKQCLTAMKKERKKMLLLLENLSNNEKFDTSSEETPTSPQTPFINVDLDV